MNAERRKQLEKAATLLEGIKDAFEEAKGIIEQCGSDEREYYDNMSDNLKGGEKGQTASEAADNLESAFQTMDINLDEIIDQVRSAIG